MSFLKIRSLFLVCIFVNNRHLNADQVLVSNFNESEYESIERVFANNTGHIDHLVDFVYENLLSQDQPKELFLDIGAGPATITHRLSKFFKSTTIIEPNKAFASIYKDTGFITYNENFQDTVIDGQYDLILCSHVLYHVPHNQWALFLKKLTELIRPGGKGLVSMVFPRGKWHALRSSINSDYSNSDKVEKALKEQDIPYELIPVQSVFRVPNYDDFRALVRLFTIDDCYLPEIYQALSNSEKELIDHKIENYIATCTQSDGAYEFIDEDVYILIHKD
jgi:SAM-dependent methyltransferase